MSREIKFRAWVNEHWVDWIPTCKTLGAYNASVIDTDGYTFEEDNPFIVEQYTGLTDKNGKEIYEGDIIQTKYMNAIGWVVWNDGAWSIRLGKVIELFLAEEVGVGCEVIGNIHENPELLEEDR